MNKRVIKFRFWDVIDKKMLYPQCGIQDVGAFFLMIGKGIKELIPQQYTGLKTKEGTEIYEGDVIQFTRAYVSKTYKDYDYENPIYGVPVNEVHMATVVFDIPTDTDDFYTDPMNGWCVQFHGVTESRSSLIGKLNQYDPDESGLVDDRYGKHISKSYTVLGFNNANL